MYLPEILFLSETKNKRWYLEEVVQKLGYHSLKTVEPLGRSGGLAVMWKNSCKVEILQANRRLIDLKVRWRDKEFFLSCVYGYLVRSKRSGVWERLTRIGVHRKEPRLLTGDFNEILDQSEKLGGTERLEEEGADLDRCFVIVASKTFSIKVTSSHGKE